jgi:hypothetical protein
MLMYLVLVAYFKKNYSTKKGRSFIVEKQTLLFLGVVRCTAENSHTADLLGL